MPDTHLATELLTPDPPPAATGGAGAAAVLWRVAAFQAAAGLALIAAAGAGAPGRPLLHLARLTLAGPLAAALLLCAVAGAVSLHMLDARARWAAQPPPRPPAAAGRAILMACGALAAIVCLLALWPAPPAPASAADPAAAAGWPKLACFLLVLAFPLLLCERTLAAIAPQRLPEARELQALARLPLGCALLCALALAASGGGNASTGGGVVGRALLIAAAAGTLAVAAELLVRAAGIWFSPRLPWARQRAPVASLLAAGLRGDAPSVLARGVRDHFGLDFSRSWALAYARAALAPLLLGMLVLGWLLTGVCQVGLDQRGSYERFGAPARVLGPGLHLLLPWPLGRVRTLDYGVIHAVAVGDAAAALAVADHATAEAPAPPSANRLWDQASDSEVSYIVAGQAGGQQSFQTVTVNLRVLYRVGLDDASALQALYGPVDPDTLVRSVTGRLLARFFAGHTLDGVLGADRDSLARGLGAAVQHELARLGSGLEVVGTVIEAIHPPGGAAVAYRSVQTAGIAAATSIAQESGRAQATRNIALRDRADTLDAAQARAAEVAASAQAGHTQMAADAAAARIGGRAFLLERYFAALRAALPGAALEILDDRLGGAEAPVLDLRGAAAEAGAAPATDMQK